MTPLLCCAWIPIVVLFAACVDPQAQMYRDRIAARGYDFSTEDFLVFGSIGEIEVFEMYIKAGIDVNARNERGNTALIITTSGTRRGRLERMRMLIAAGAEVNVQNRDGMTALKVAIVNGDLQAVKLLIESGADVGHKSEGRVTPLQLATAGPPQSRATEAIAAMLREAGARE